MKHMIQKLVSIVVLMVFIAGAMPAAIANYHMEREVEAQWLEAHNAEKKEMKLQPVAVGPDGKSIVRKLPTQKISTQVRLYEEEIKLEKEIENIKKEHDIDGYMEELKREGNFNNGKALIITRYALKIAHRLENKMDYMKQKIGSNGEFMKSHTDALEIMEKLMIKLKEIGAQLQGAASDDAITREEWTKTVVPALKNLRKLINELREKHQGFFNEWRQKHMHDSVGDIIKKLTEKREKIKQHLLEKGVSEKEVMKRLQEIEQEIAKLREAAGIEGPRSFNAGSGMKPDMAPERDMKMPDGMSMKAEKADSKKIKESLMEIKEVLKGSEYEERHYNDEDEE